MSSRTTISAVIYGTAIFVACSNCASVQAQSQTVRVRVPGVAAINASSHFEQIIHDRTNAAQQFNWQNWQVVCNNAKGAVVTFQTDHAFRHTTKPSVKRNVALLLEEVSANKWKITTATDQTNYAAGDELAVVSADTKKATDGTFRLRVTFLEESFVNALAGDYEMTITGTIAPK